MFRLTLSNRFEFLLDDLLDRLANEACPPMVSQQVIVPSTAIRRRIELACADRLGICANIDFSYLAQWLWARIGQLVDVQDVSPFAAARLTWRIFEIFADTAFCDPHPRLARYLLAADPVMRLDLAQRSAQLIEHYITYRPQWLAAWSAGKQAGISGLDASQASDERWQAALWRRITSELGTRRQHPAAIFFEKIQELGGDARRLAGLPNQASIFCLPTLPPLYLEILRQLADWIDIQVYTLNPCREYWFDIVAPSRLCYLAVRERAAYHEVGNTLLASWGKQTQAHVDLLFSDNGQIVEENSRFAAAAGERLLARIQNAILDLRELPPGSVKMATDDRSIEVHVCHSLTRELEVLHDQLLAEFAAADPVIPEQVVVLLPNLKEAAPLIDAVFGTAPAERRIPYTITGLPQTRSNPLACVLDRLMTICASRFTASDVFDLLQQPPVAARFAFTVADLENIHGWLRDSGIRWGLDADSRDRVGLPPSERHSFADGLHRLFLAYALGDDAAAGRTVVAERIAAGNPEGSDAATLGRFWQFVAALERLRSEWSQTRDADAWQRSLGDALERFARTDNALLDELRAVRAAISELHDHMRHGCAQSPLPLPVVHRALNAVLDDPARGGVPTGVVTFSSLSSLRMLPYRLVCLLGMNDGAFPSADRTIEFDLLARQAQPGDRQRRFDERNLFLDLVVAARQRLYLSYSGRSIRDNSVLPPSVLLAELLDYIANACAEHPDEPASVAEARRRLVVEHPLQAFSPDSFRVDGDPRRRSFHTEYCRALQACHAPSTRAPAPLPCADEEPDEEFSSDHSQPFFRQALSPPPVEWQQVGLAQLQQFFRNPCRVLLVKRLAIALTFAEEELANDEPFLPDHAGRQALARRLLPALLTASDSSDSEVARLALAAGEFPSGPFGQRLLGEELTRLRAFAAELKPRLAVSPLAAVDAHFDYFLADETWQLSGVLSDLRPDGLLRYRYDDARATDYLTGWIEHLFLCAGAPPDIAWQTHWFSRDGSFRLKPCPPARARAHLGELLALYRRGLRAPLHFFPKSAWAYVNSDRNPLAAARRCWVDSRNADWGESADPAVRLAFRGLPEPLDDDFEHCANSVFRPLIEHLEDSRG